MPQQSFEIRELDKEHEWLEAFSVMKQLRTHLDEKSYLELVKAGAKKIIIEWLHYLLIRI